MPKKKSVQSLRDLCMPKVAKEFHNSENQIDAIPGTLINDLFERKFEFHIDYKKLSSQIFINPLTRELNFNCMLQPTPHNECENFCKICRSFTAQLVDTVLKVCSDQYVQRIDLSNRKVEPSLQAKLIERFYQIQFLDLTGLCTDNVLTVIGTHCTQLRYLNIQECRKVTDIGINSLCTNKPMIIDHLDIRECRVTSNGCLCALNNLKFLKKFKHSCWSKLFKILKPKKNPAQIYSVESLPSECRFNTEKLNVASKIFPNVRKLTISNLDFNNIVNHNYFQKITCLTLRVENICIPLMGFCCPLIEILDLEIYKYDQLIPVQTFPYHIPYKHLRNLSLCCYKGNVLKNELQILLENCYDLTELSIVDCKAFTDSFFKKIVSWNPLSCLTTFRAYFCHSFSVNSVMMLLQMENVLSNVVIHHCKLFKQVDDIQLQRYVNINNLDVVVNVYGRLKRAK